MKNKTIPMLATALLMGLTACQTTEILDQRQDGKITLRTSVNTATKATPLSKDVLSANGFHLAVLDGPIIDSGSSVYFEMDMGSDQLKEDGYYTDYYWNDKTLHFYAWYPKNVAVDASDFYSISFAAAQNVADQKDLSLAYNTGNKADNDESGVLLNFRHALSQIQMVVNNGSTLPNNNVIVKAVKVGNAIKGGTLRMPSAPTSAAAAESNLLTNLWEDNVKTATGDKNVNTYSIVHETPIVITNGESKTVMGNGGNWMLVPQVNPTAWDVNAGGAGDQMYMALLVKLMQGSITVYPSDTTPAADKEDGYAWTAVPIPANSILEAGKKYTFTLTFKINTGNAGNRISDGKEVLSHPIKLNVTVDDWLEVTGGETLY
jgi:hypothetical protein